MTSSSDSSSFYTSSVQCGLPMLMQHFRPALVFKTLIPLSSTLYLLRLHPHHRFMLLAVSTSPAFSSPLSPSGFFDGMLAVSEPGALNFYTFFRLIPLSLFLSSNLTSIHFPLSESLNSVLHDLITPTPDLAFSLLMPRMLVTVSSYLSVRAYFSRNFLPPLFLYLTPTLIM